MAGYPLHALLTVRLLRERAAERNVIRARTAAMKAREDLSRARAELERYAAWRPDEEARLFETLCGRHVKLNDLDRHREDIETLRAGELAREEQCMALARDVEKADEAVRTAQRTHMEAIRGREKIGTHKERWEKEEAARLEAVEEAELEDFMSRSAEDMEHIDCEVINECQ